MCCFSGSVRSVTNTRIFARILPDHRQALIYSMSLDTPRDVAMILPIPVAAGSGEDAVRFINLEKYPGIFSDLERLFMESGWSFGVADSIRSAPAAKAKLEVVRIGAFNASFVPTIKDFSRLDEQFRLPAGVWEKLGNYTRYGFAVFKLRKGQAEVHPMAFSFPTALGARLFLPTVHIHDGKVHATAGFDHTLYVQTSNGKNPNVHNWEESESLAKSSINMENSRGLVAARQHVFRMTMHGRLRNVDVVV